MSDASMFYCGIDVAKRKHAVVVLDEKGQVHRPVFTVENTRAGMDFLVSVLNQVGGELRVALESTGHYWLPLYDCLTRAGYPVAVINHSDQGSQYTSLAFGSRCREAGILPWMGSVGDAYDNALCESFFATLECELLERHVFRTHGRPPGGVRVHRRLVQSASPAFVHRLPFADPIRVGPSSQPFIPRPSGVHSTGVTPGRSSLPPTPGA